MDFAKIRPRGGTKAQWEKANPVLAKREIGVQWETTIGVGEVVIKIGDGVTDWINLPEAVKSDITKKIIAALAVVPDDDPDLADGDSLDTLFGKIAKKFKYLKDNKLDKSARYDGTDSTSTELVPTANALRGVNAKADKNASDITTLNNNLSKRIGIVGYKGGWLADASSENNRIFVLNFDSDKGQDQMIVFKDRISVTLLRDGVWQEQYKVATLNDLWPQSSGTEIIAKTDMRTITTPGHYYCANNSTAASLKNCPLSDAFTLVVYRSAGGVGDNVYYVAQEYTSYMCNRRVIQTYNKDSKNWTTHEIQFKS